MRRSMESVGLNTALIDWMQVQLDKAPAALQSDAQEFSAALAHLAQGSSNSLLLELDDTPTPATGERILCGALTVDLRSRRVTRDGVDILLTPKEFDILYFLARNRGQVFTKEQIYQAVWENEHLLDDSNIMAFIRKLRKKIEPAPDAPTYILTVWGIGYKFNDSL